MNTHVLFTASVVVMVISTAISITAMHFDKRVIASLFLVLFIYSFSTSVALFIIACKTNTIVF